MHTDKARLFFAVPLKPDSGAGASPRMTPLKPPSEVRAEMSRLIAEAVSEPDDNRRHGLLVLADHWSDILRRRRAAGDAVGSRGPTAH